MIWLIGIVSFVIGLGIGAVIFKQYLSDATKVEQLEDKLSKLQSEHEHYKNSVHSHFSSTAQVVNNLTDSYREVYRHLAAGAQSLCPENISNQLSLATNTDDLLKGQQPDSGSSCDSSYDSSYDSSPSNLYSSPNSDKDEIFPPRDYANKTNPNQKGSLSEDYGLEKSLSEEVEDSGKIPPPQEEHKLY